MRLRVFAAAAVLAGTTVLGSAAMASAHAGDGGPDGATAVGNAQNSPGVLSGNNIQVPVNIPVEVCGNTIDVIGLLNPAFGNACETQTD
ncbi:chaplin [Streptomyces sp. NPDC046939]|uniref:chaplin n=1 Tax=Streptomyces sp. NPDC046939 TaxID=3155376 RepID=UPI0033CD435C